jgi:DNA mismatch repair protein MutS
VPKANYQLNIFDARDPKMEQVKALLDKVDINTISPVEALLKLNEMQMVMRKEK